MSKITSFQGEHRWLSNFWPVNVFYEAACATDGGTFGWVGKE